MFTCKGGIVSNNPRDISSIFFTSPVYIGIITLVGWILLKYFCLHLKFLSFTIFGSTFSITLRGLLLVFWMISLYNLIHIIFCMFYMFRHNIFKTHQPWKYLILPKWYNAL